MLSRSIAFFKNIALSNASPRQLAFAVSLGTYVAFSPFFGFHTIMLVAAGWLFNLNIPFLIAVGYGINNPWTMIPIYMSGYLFGYWLLHTVAAVPVLTLNPSWMGWFNEKVMVYLQIKELSFWAFMLGGNVLGILLAIVAYPVTLLILKKMHSRRQINS